MSLFLFIIFTELLFRILHKWECNGKINGVKLGRASPIISHLMFSMTSLSSAKLMWKKIKML